jgi:hypothetical protein
LFNQPIVTEGLAKVAKEMGCQPYGFSSVPVWHKWHENAESKYGTATDTQ